MTPPVNIRSPEFESTQVSSSSARWTRHTGPLRVIILSKSHTDLVELFYMWLLGVAERTEWAGYFYRGTGTFHRLERTRFLPGSCRAPAAGGRRRAELILLTPGWGGEGKVSRFFFLLFFFCSNSLEAPLSAHKTPMYPVKILHLLPSHLPSPTLMSFVCLPGHNNTAVTSGCRRERSMPSVRGCCW